MQNNIIKNESILEVFKRNYLNHKTELENLKGDFTDLFFNYARMITEADRDSLPPQSDLNKDICTIKMIIDLISEIVSQEK